MADFNNSTLVDPVAPAATPTQSVGNVDLIVHVTPSSIDALEQTAGLIASALQILSSTPSTIAQSMKAALVYPASDALTVYSGPVSGLQLASYQSTEPPGSNPWLHSAQSYQSVARASTEHGARAILMLGPDAGTLDPAAIAPMIHSVLNEGVDLVMPLYTLHVFEGMLNSAIFYPLTRALYGLHVRNPLGTDLALSSKFLERLAASAGRSASLAREEALVWPATVASLGNFKLAQAEVGQRRVTQPEGVDLSSLLGQIAGSLFADVDANAAYWQRIRRSQPLPPLGKPVQIDEPTETIDVTPMVESFQLALVNLLEIWMIVLSPYTLLGLKRLGQMPIATFRMPDSLWVRIIYDFALAYRLRSINRKHLLGALTPLYLAWVASHVLEIGTRNRAAAEERIEMLARAFESDKPYLVSRWRWPDRFNP
jgi:hypothetical protein